MPKNLCFWTNVGLIAAAHIAIIAGLIHWSREHKDFGAPTVVWMNGGAGDGVVPEKKNLPATAKSPLPRKESKTDSFKERETDEDRPYLASAPSDIQLPTPKPKPTPTATPVRSPKPSPTAKAKSTPKPTPKPTPTASPARAPKKITLAKASPKPSPIVKPTPEKKENEQADGEPEQKEIAKAIPVKNDSSEKEPKKTSATQTGSGKGAAPGTGSGHAGGSANDSKFGWYGSMLHDRFYSEWVQPTTDATAGSKNSVLVKLRIEKDGRVSSFEVVRPSGGSELDESVKAIANRVSRVEPLPDGLGKGDHYDVKINFELNSE